ncbi:hypothetical protein A2871_02230 [Candidatus Daviesbacteria bacterium RIFCSPHIGHO2_01_FULL_41_23]|uniref:Peptidase S74 domain-containing protein n=1 Tax=Candidatus Daviesbacteria bacterium RIFCSPHIGHO2_01_FULL_41_23 TaxID=1797764 RepID=A0A1F5ITW7_9BACT|nr:MAG: hypothetical protein A2871_02230 [Candidatus Daviesbacteria bacterium RIFCSPHIGHO2_01_FULL_41_23]
MLPKSKLLRRLAISGLSLVVIIAGIAVFDKNTGIIEKTNKLAGEVAGLALTGKFLNYKIPGVLPASAVAPAPYQNVSGDVAISGRVGIGIVSPAAPLHVVGTNATVAKFESTGIAAQIKLKSNYGVANQRVKFIRAELGGLDFGSYTDTENDSNPQMFIANNGNVGIGTVTPVVPLAVYGTSDTTIGILGEGKTLTAGNLGSGDSYIMSGVRDSSAGDPGILLLSQGEGGWLAGMDNSDDNKLKFSSIWNNLAGGAKVTFTKDGNVGIGTASPSNHLEIADPTSVTTGEHINFTTHTGTATAGNAAGIAVGWYANGTSNTGGILRSINSLPLFLGTFTTPQAVTVLNNGNVGIGKVDPTSKLHIVGGAGPSDTVNAQVDSANGAAAELVLKGGSVATNRRAGIRFFSKQIGNSAGEWFMGESRSQISGDDNFYITSIDGLVNTDRLVIQRNGRVGIGTASPNPIGNLTLAGDGALILDQDGADVWRINSGGDSTGLQFQTVDRTTNVTTDRVVIRNSGNVGIGTAGPRAALEVANGNIYQSYDSNSLLYGIAVRRSTSGGFTYPDISSSNGNTIVLAGNDRGGGTVAINGNVGIGTVSPNAKLEIQAGFDATQTAPIEAIRIWGPNSPYNETSGQDIRWAFAAAGSAVIRGYRGENWGTYMRILTSSDSGGATPTGGVSIGNGATSWSAVSDSRLKTNITNITNALKTINELNPVNFNWKDPAWTKVPQLGLIAQDVNKVLPQIVTKDPDGYLGVQYSELIPVTIAAIKEQQKQISPLFNIIDVVNKIGRFVTVETQKLIVSGVDILERINFLSQKVDAQQKEIDALKAEINQLKANP